MPAHVTDEGRTSPIVYEEEEEKKKPIKKAES